MSDTTPFKVLIVDDHPLMRRAIRQLLECDSAFHVVAETGDGNNAVALAARYQVDVILLDLSMKTMSGLETLTALRQNGCNARIIVLTVCDAASSVCAMTEAGASGYLLKDTEPEILLEAIRQGASGVPVFSDGLHAHLHGRHDPTRDPLRTLTERELDVLHEIARGMTNKQIAGELNISEQTVKVHIRNLLRKLNVRSRVAASVLFIRAAHPA
ncbi:nitrate/nitrite response regulator protein NarP [Shimwellia blattae DSM 4481 = NBRC 105725]|uniref:Nitrate/nitrite response regulator protein NarP n=1 Tax=Shimwellia blattae (strain ATCC 29907 / DSM 4481 / JCM 1650 / NBRC 105725 / CDC 9005-74) TaxID=630626 RepID=I2B9M3_SHIBC|nr:response regulator [Shimwellia blattae]AFJ47227.1 nitrate/nitrite response regulator protein NarP [Shimwellia blattae DSM 4481 = NBRC 105725]GAB82244.1 nitrate/nitrite response regulator NarP [Shimwellia blattae DSM 4481 = NBRC 105725]VEC22819.1 Nitrate/nitrite response regulator protein narL [Shimwellia blattae]